MFDLNALISAALNAAVQQAITPLLDRIENLDAVCQAQAERIAVLAAELIADKPAITIDEAKMVEALNSQEWFWEKLQNRIDAATEQAVDDHCGTYDHDDYAEMASKVDDLPDFDDFVKSRDVEDTVRDVVGSLSFDISVS